MIIAHPCFTVFAKPLPTCVVFLAPSAILLVSSALVAIPFFVAVGLGGLSPSVFALGNHGFSFVEIETIHIFESMVTGPADTFRYLLRTVFSVAAIAVALAMVFA
jgi:hypothetical protein